MITPFQFEVSHDRLAVVRLDDVLGARSTYGKRLDVSVDGCNLRLDACLQRRDVIEGSQAYVAADCRLRRDLIQSSRGALYLSRLHS